MNQYDRERLYFEPQAIRDGYDSEVDPGRFGQEPQAVMPIKPWATQAELWGVAPYQIAAYAKIAAELDAKRPSAVKPLSDREKAREILAQDGRSFTGGYDD